MKQETLFPPPTLEKIASALIASDQIPLLNAPFSFPFDEFAQKLSKLFEGKEIKIIPKTFRWKTKEELFHAIGESSSSTPLLLSPLEGEALWIISKVDMHKLTTSLLFKNGETKGFLSDVLEEGYFRYLFLESLLLFSKTSLFSPFSLKLSDSQEAEDCAYLVQDLQIKVDNHTCYSRIAISSKLQKSWQNHFASAPALFSDKIASQVELPLSLHIGSTSILPSLWEKISVGDFLLLDPMDYDPKKGKFSLLVAFQSVPLFHAKMNESTIELINPASFHEETSMEDNNSEISVNNIPIHIAVEIGKIPLTLQKLTQLQPGNFLEMPSSDKTVSLLVDGKKLASGELVYIGDALGVRITEISS